MSKIAKFLRKTKNYALVVGFGLFLLGFFGFIFKSSSSISNAYLLLAIIVGFWGIIIGLSDSIEK